MRLPINRLKNDYSAHMKAWMLAENGSDAWTDSLIKTPRKICPHSIYTKGSGS